MAEPAKRELRWEHLTGPEVQALARETNVALLPVGCLEMHGPHLPTGTDGFHGLAFCERAARMELAIVLPTIFYNITDEMQDYPGGIHISPETMTRLYDGICSECARNGFDHIIFMVSHGGSENAMDDLMANALAERTRTGKWPYIVVRTFIVDLMRAEIAERFVSGVHDRHGGPVETAVIQALRPELVHLKRVRAPSVENPRTLPFTRPRVPRIRQTPLGYTSDPRLADPQKGEELVDAAAGHLAEVIRAFKTFDPDKDC
jgi:creatinine amidohydrolase